MHKTINFFMFFLSINIYGQEKLNGFGNLHLNKTTFQDAQLLISNSFVNYYGSDYGSNDSNVDSSLVELTGKYEDLSVGLKLSFFNDTLYKIDVGNDFVNDVDDKKTDSSIGDFYEAFIMKFGKGKLSVKAGYVLCKCRYCKNPMKFYDYDSIRIWNNNQIFAKMRKKYTTVYANGGCNGMWESSLEIENLSTIERTKLYLKKKEEERKENIKARTIELYRKL